MLKLAKVAGPLAVGVSLLMSLATAARAEPVLQDRPEHGKVIMCAARDAAKARQGLLPTGKMNNVTAYLEADENACAVGPARLVVVLR